MFRKLFLSLIIISSLTYESGAYYSPSLIDYYLVNLSNLDMMQQDSRNAISGFSAKRLELLDKKGTPVSFYKFLSQDSINSKAQNNNMEFLWISGQIVALAIFVVFIILLDNNISFITRRALLSLTDSSPPAYC